MPLINDESAAIKAPKGSDLEKAILQATSTSEILNLLHNAAVDQHLVVPDPIGGSQDWFTHKVVQQPAVANAPHVKVLRVNGVAYELRADSEAGLVAAELAKMKELIGPAASTEQTRDANGRFVAQQTQEEIEAEALRVAALDPAAVALAPTVKAVLESQGISVDDLKSFTEQKRGERFAAEWAAAGEAFRNSPAGENYPGGTENQRILGEIIVKNGLMNAENKADVIAQAYAYMCEHGLVAATDEEKAAAAKKSEAEEIQNAADPEALRAILRARGHLQPLNSSGLWGR
jgi:hypothetical protein